MANPNIAAVSELHVGTLAWNLKTSQVIFVKGVKERETYSTTATAELYCPSNVAGITLSNKIVFVFSFTSPYSSYFFKTDSLKRG